MKHSVIEMSVETVIADAGLFYRGMKGACI